MKDKDTFKKILGISQKEIATILDITRSQWSMYEIGKRNLPLSATLEFTKMLKYIQENDSKEIEINYSSEEYEKQAYDQLKKEMKKNMYELDGLNIKIEQAQRFYDDGLAALRVVEYLETQPENERIANVKKLIQCKAIVKLQKNNELLRKHNLDRQLLQLRNAVIEKEIKNNFKKYNPDN
jgi:transcriptional regulator with XRE-family HTH domain